MSESERQRERPVVAEIQALRAVAVVLVVVFHLRPTWLVGGFIGVDVFFVISGYLITRHLIDEAVETGRVALARFWARRARRLLPAALLVLVVTAAATLALLPSTEWARALRGVVSSALYVQNWSLALDSADYFAIGQPASPVQHYWSLSVEEQFYLVWPLVIIAMIAVSRVLWRPGVLGAITAGLVLVVVVSFAASVLAAIEGAQGAYFFTHVRAWEFGLGGLAAIALRRGGLQGWNDAARASVAWAGWIGIAVSAALIPQSTAFPGWVALAPVASTLAVIAAGPSNGWWSPSRWAGFAPVTRVGDWSYSIYLWHWPVIIIGGAMLSAPLPIGWAAAAVALTLVLAALTYRFVENPVRRAPSLTEARPRRTAAAALVATVLVIVVPLGGAIGFAGLVGEGDERTQQAIAAGDLCFGAASIDALVDCSGANRGPWAPDLAIVEESLPPYVEDECRNRLPAELFDRCERGPVDAAFRILVIGDSHAGQWESAVGRLAEARGWSYTIAIRGGCPWSTAPKRGDDAVIAARCASHSDALVGELATRESWDLIVTSWSVGSPNAGRGDEVVAGFRDAWAPVVARGTPIVVIRDTPNVGDTVTDCLAAHRGEAELCAVPRSLALGDDEAVTAAEGFDGVTVIDLSRYFCNEEVCPVVIGGVVVYRDGNHVTDAYMQTLAPAFARELESAGVLPAD
ncbi:MAG: hypothetical protein RL499_719 [Actinomycetota bacterium]